MFERNGELKPALYTLRVLLTGIHLMRTGQVVADLRELCRAPQVPYVPELIEGEGPGRAPSAPGLMSIQVDLLRDDVTRLRAALAEAAAASHLPEQPSARDNYCMT